MRYLFVFSGLLLSCTAAFAQPVAGDTDLSGLVDAVDVQFVVNAVLNVTEQGLTDIDLSGATDAIDIQLVVNAVLGLSIDADEDGLADAAEENIGTDMDLDDTDGDGVLDGQEIIDRTDPLVNEREVPDAQVYDAATGLTLHSGPFDVSIPAGMDSLDGETLFLRLLADEELLAGGLPEEAGFNTGFELGPEGLTFDEPVQVRVAVDEPAFVGTLPVLSLDEINDQWGGAPGTSNPSDGEEMTAGVVDAGQGAVFELDRTGRYQVWDPPAPNCDDPELEPLPDTPIAGSAGLYAGLPFSLSPGYVGTDASFLFTKSSGFFGLSLVNEDVEHPVTGETVTLQAELHAAETVLEDCFALGVIRPAGLSGSSAYSDEISPTRPVHGLMYLQVKGGQWAVNTYAVYEGGLILGEGTGGL